MKRASCLFLSLLFVFLAGCEATAPNTNITETDGGIDMNTVTEPEETVNPDAEYEYTLEYPMPGVTSGDGDFEVSYETESYVKIGETINLNAAFVKSDGERIACTFESQDKSIAKSNLTGKVKGFAAGTCAVRAYVNAELYIDFYVTVLPENISDALMLAVKANNSNIFVREELGIGAGTPVYYRDIYGSVSKLLYNDPLEIDRTYQKIGTDNKAHSDGPRSKHKFELEYVTVHYTGNMNVNATAKNNAEYFAYTTDVSVHYVTGNDGVYCCLDDGYVSWNAGDRASGKGALKWSATGVAAPEDWAEIEPEFGVSENGRFTINGNETTVKIPKRGSGIKVTGNTFEYQGETYNTINDMGLPWKVADGEYYLGSTWWSFRATSAGAICGIGGDYNSISIESAVNPETDLWYTWQKTAQLVAKLLVDNNLDLTRVTGHHMWTQKDCPQPLLENEKEIWYEFMDMVECEYNLLKEFSDCEYIMEMIDDGGVSTDTDKKKKLVYNDTKYTYTQNPGRVIPNGDAHIVLYEVTVKTPSGTESIKLASAVNKVN